MTASRLEDLSLRHNLNPAEAEQLFHRREAGEDENTAAQAIKDARVVFRVHVEKTYNPESDPREVAAKRRAFAEAEDLGPAPRPEDKTAPEAGPYGPSTDYTEAATGTVTRSSDLPR